MCTYDLTPYLPYGFSDETSHHHPLCVDEQVGLGLCGSAQSHLLETQLVICHATHILCLTHKQETNITGQVYTLYNLYITCISICQTHTFLMAYFGSSGMTRRIFPSQNSATTRSFFQPWKHNREKKLQAEPRTHNKLTSP